MPTYYCGRVRPILMYDGASVCWPASRVKENSHENCVKWRVLYTSEIKTLNRTRNMLLPKQLLIRLLSPGSWSQDSEYSVKLSTFFFTGASKLKWSWGDITDHVSMGIWHREMRDQKRVKLHEADWDKITSSRDLQQRVHQECQLPHSLQTGCQKLVQEIRSIITLLS